MDIPLTRTYEANRKANSGVDICWHRPVVKVAPNPSIRPLIWSVSSKFATYRGWRQDAPQVIAGPAWPLKTSNYLEPQQLSPAVRVLRSGSSQCTSEQRLPLNVTRRHERVSVEGLVGA